MSHWTRGIPKPAGYYRSLNRRSTADVYDQTTELRQQLSPRGSDVYEVERLVSSRLRKGGAEYLVLWAGYPKEDSCWVKEQDITPVALQYFISPQPSYREIADSVSNFTEAIDKSLRMGVNRGCHFSIEFRTDTFKFLFEEKGTDVDYGTGQLYELADFDKTYFTGDWYRAYNRLGDGCELDFPVRMSSTLKWSRVVYTDTLVPKKRHYREICTVWVTNKRC